MQRIQFHRYGGPDEMRLEAYQLPALADDEILVKTRAASINPVDWKIRQGKMKLMTGRRFPRGMGQDFSGLVQAIGQRVTRFKVGDEVLGTTPARTASSFAEALITKEALAVSKPTALSHEEAATLPVAGSTAWIALVEKAQLQPGQSVFINGAYGAVGQAATQIAKAVGASVTGRVGVDCMDAARVMGVDTVLDYTRPIPPALLESFDVVFDTHGGLTITEGRKLARAGGVVLHINPSPSKMLRIFFSCADKFVLSKQDADTMQNVATLASDGKLRISVGRAVPLAAGIALIRSLEAGERIRGKGLILMGTQR